MTVLATAWDPVAGLAVAVLACVVAPLAFCAQRSTSLPPIRRTGRAGSARRCVADRGAAGGRRRGALGVLFGAEVATVAPRAGKQAYAGALLALSLGAWWPGS